MENMPMLTTWLKASNVMAEAEDRLTDMGMGIGAREIKLTDMGKATVTFTFNAGRLALTSDLRRTINDVVAEEGAALVDMWNFWDAKTLCIDLVNAPDKEVSS